MIDLCLAYLLPWAEAAGKAVPKGEIPFSFYLQVLNLLVVYGVMAWIFKRFLVPFFADRRLQFEESLRRAEASRKEAERALSEISSKMAQAQAEEKSVLARAHEQVEKLKREKTVELEALEKRLDLEFQSFQKSRLASARRLISEELIAVTFAKVTRNFQSNLNPQDAEVLKKNTTHQLSKVAVSYEN